jgi:hypothetical protein
MVKKQTYRELERIATALKKDTFDPRQTDKMMNEQKCMIDDAFSGKNKLILL